MLIAVFTFLTAKIDFFVFFFVVVVQVRPVLSGFWFNQQKLVKQKVKGAKAKAKTGGESNWRSNREMALCHLHEHYNQLARFPPYV